MKSLHFNMEPGGFVPGGGLPSGATNMSQLSPGVWGWAGADTVNANMAMMSRDLDRKGEASVVHLTDVVMPGVVLGLETAVSETKHLEEHKVEECIAVGKDLKAPGPEFMSTVYPFEDEDAASLLPFFPKAFKKIEQIREDGGAVLVYCATGQASTALCVGYKMAKEELSYDDAMAQVQEARPNALPEGLNRNLSRQLTTWRKWPEFPGLPDWM
uniref:Tyrosine specific protein phosphatases domain-containing protein n=1 Tax=Hemiselmis andersenii TaxID=464988 RepID=A0A6T8HF30_HEMAN